MKHRIFRVAMPMLMLGAALFFSTGREASAQCGAGLDPAVVTAWYRMKINGTPKYMVLKSSEDNKSVVVEKTFDSSTSFNELVALLPPREPRFYIVSYTSPESAHGGTASGLILVEWTPVYMSVLTKAKFATVSAVVKNAFSGIGAVVNVSSEDEFNEQALVGELKRQK